MEQEVFQVLEYDRIREMLADRAGSLMGKEIARELLPSGELDEVQDRLRETAEAVRLLAISSPPLGGIRDIRSGLKKGKLGAMLEAGEILDVISSMYAMRGVKRFFKEQMYSEMHSLGWLRQLLWGT